MYDRFLDDVLNAWSPKGFCRLMGWQRWTPLRLFTYVFAACVIFPTWAGFDLALRALDHALRSGRW